MRNIRKNYIYNLIYEVFMLIVPVAVTPYVSRSLGVFATGLYSYKFSIVTYFVMFSSLGFPRYAQRIVAKYQGNIYIQSRIFYEIIIARIIPVVISLFFYTGFVFCFGEKNNKLFLILMIHIVASAFDITFFFQGNEFFGTVVVRNILIKSIGYCLIFATVKNEYDVNKYAAIQALIVLASNVSLCFCLAGKIKKVPLIQIHPLRHIHGSFILFLPTIATSVYTSLDKTLLGIITKSNFENGNYEYAEYLVKMSLTVITSLGSVMAVRNAYEYEKGNIDIVLKNINNAIRFTMMVGIPFTMGIQVIADGFVPWYLGEGYSKAAVIMKIMAPLVIIIGTSNVIGIQYLIPIGKDKVFTISIVTGALINFILNIILIPKLMSYGAAIASVIAEATITAIMIVCSKCVINVLTVLRQSWKYALAAVIMYNACAYLERRITYGVLSTIGVIMMGLFIYLTCLLFFRDDFFNYNLSKIRESIKKHF
ncbi:oligosaccharide flippase family protein [Butyrivibrio sp. AE3004]|uniref:oligosaccharide flippase family protein n=1 Tax=Butyrivibrio sp. AE3004 TaxID=1506994 RepID=UPI0009DE7B16|nr:polysaccharide biosynthesis C-terminal domain-containing protein [Butyrivibrio sp. AE3004]